MKRGFTLLELVVALVIFGVISTIAYSIFSQTFSTYLIKQETNILYEELLSTKLSLQNRFFEGRDFVVTGNSISFYELEHSAFEDQVYSGFAQLDDNATTKSQVKTIISPYSPIDLYIGFNTTIYPIESIEEDKIILKDKTTPKVFSENYYLYTKTNIVFEHGSIFVNGSLLVENITSSVFELHGNILQWNVCAKSSDKTLCKKMEFAL